MLLQYPATVSSLHDYKVALWGLRSLLRFCAGIQCAARQCCLQQLVCLCAALSDAKYAWRGRGKGAHRDFCECRNGVLSHYSTK